MDEQLRAIVAAFAEELIPSDDLPGAREAGIADEMVLALDAAPHLKAGLAALNQASLAAFQIGFSEASSAQRCEMMAQLARGEQPEGWIGPPAAQLWIMLRHLGLSLFYGSELSRQVTGFPGPSVDQGGYRHTIVEPDPC